MQCRPNMVFVWTHLDRLPAGSLQPRSSNVLPHQAYPGDTLNPNHPHSSQELGSLAQTRDVGVEIGQTAYVLAK